MLLEGLAEQFGERGCLDVPQLLARMNAAVDEELEAFNATFRAEDIEGSIEDRDLPACLPLWIPITLGTLLLCCCCFCCIICCRRRARLRARRPRHSVKLRSSKLDEFVTELQLAEGPATGEDVPPPPPYEEASISIGSESELPPGWEMIMSGPEGDAQPYFFNTLSGESQWEMPVQRAGLSVEEIGLDRRVLSTTV